MEKRGEEKRREGGDRVGEESKGGSSGEERKGDREGKERREE